jgi:hypothetical protein
MHEEFFHSTEQLLLSLWNYIDERSSLYLVLAYRLLENHFIVCLEADIHPPPHLVYMPGKDTELRKPAETKMQRSC